MRKLVGFIDLEPPVPRSNGRHLPGSGSRPEAITVAVRWYLPYGLSYRDVKELLAKRGIEIDHVTVYRWVQRFTETSENFRRYYRR